ncbi:hypothetical protein J5U23_00694 [Saccharolobus shibatae B12]|uniref:Uncharacterized protein n=1 Tax=Saccharolobus shibatae (strain ATCC 51178 / DSM 5389 / JCM 8931 / NBRC 15437 / B12) TaxID=523848 RepID=A0A8F5GSJ9_SACSH|nr:hypothetical protein [Saccharolobus shibatae]QXJ27826.1 hypothetical protein J5U23_00694 [Saccharolobus shibatae B12]
MMDENMAKAEENRKGKELIKIKLPQTIANKFSIMSYYSLNIHGLDLVVKLKNDWASGIRLSTWPYILVPYELTYCHAVLPGCVYDVKVTNDGDTTILYLKHVGTVGKWRQIIDDREKHAMYLAML